ncbi:MAG: sigma-70 family RNA polymerase sigma factor [Planococcaceae bacterium]|nr:sigma-70 family RNA polymerase sigma factor [Planococcaceae bacterium]
MNLQPDKIIYLKEKNENLLTQLMREHGDELKRIAFLYVNDLSECEDIIQEVFITCYHQLSNFRGESSYKTWLIRITINKCKDYKKKWSVRNIIYRKEVSSNKPNSFENERNYESEEIIKYISLLSNKYKEVVILYYYQEMSMKEISETLNISINTIKSRLLRAKKSLQSKLERSDIHGSF